jgi:hypothetical protein
LDIARKGMEAYQGGDVDAVFEVATDDVGRAGFETMMRQWERPGTSSAWRSSS